MAFGTARAAEGRRGRGRGARARPPGRAPRRARGADDLRRRAPAPAAAARLAARASSRCAARSPRASRPTASTSPHALAHALGRVGQASRASPGFVAVISDFRDQRRLDAPARRAARAPLGAGRRGRRPARGRAARRRPPRRRRPRDRRARSRSTPRAARVRERFAALERERRDDASRASCAACTSTTSRCRPIGDWLLELGRRLR